ncbi:aquaporin [Rubrivirga marina]|uniref:Aquaporin n=2 Tax=Rubrivirga marina TaxID=1196024 RepID=A0A271IXA1_9BACT|nr:aquaporin [Rubrivirga marina]
MAPTAVEVPSSPAVWRAALAEALGTFALVFAGCGAVVVEAQTGALGHVGVALTFGLVVMAAIYAVGEVSGAHINPAVTVAFWASGRFPGGRVVPYALAQIGGALVAAGLLRALFPEAATLGQTVPAGTALQSLGLEAVLTFLLMFVILGVAVGAKEVGLLAGVAIGGSVAFEALMGGPVSGASMNPARSLGPALVSGDLGALWVYLVGPTLGALVAVPAYRAVYGDRAPHPLTRPLVR